MKINWPRCHRTTAFSSDMKSEFFLLEKNGMVTKSKKKKKRKISTNSFKPKQMNVLGFLLDCGMWACIFHPCCPPLGGNFKIALKGG